MARLLTLLMIVVLVAANGSTVASAICRHRDASEHAMARQSRDAKVAAVALSEEAAAGVASKNGALGSSASLSLPAYIVPEAAVPPAPRAAEPARSPQAEAPPLPGRSIRPLLEPPVA